MSATARIPYFRASLTEPPALVRHAGFQSPHGVLEWHQPVDRWQLLVLTHPGVVSCNGRIAAFGAPSALVFPPRARVRLDRSGLETYEHTMAMFEPKDSTEDIVALPLVTDISPVFAGIEQMWVKAFNRIQFTRTGARSWVWSLLWYLAAGSEKIRTNIYVEEAEKLIQQRLGERIVILDLARELEISHSQLVRLFREEHGTTIQEYIRVQRAVTATRLLTTTTRPIKAIATAVGVPNLQQFSRLIVGATGVSPRTLRVERKEFDILGEARPGQ